MSSKTQPAIKSYFFSKGYLDVWNTIKGAWQRNFESINKCGENITNASKSQASNGKLGVAVTIFLAILNILAVIAILACGSIVTVLVSLANIAVLLVMMLVVYIGFSVIWLVDRLYLVRKKIFTACHECKEKSLIPTYICPRCKAKHTNLTPGVYGILHRTCKGETEGVVCGEKLPTTFFNGRRNLEAICPVCSTPLSDRESVPICIPVVGGRSVGKTAFITAFSRDFIEKVAPSKSLETEFYNEKKADIYREIERDYQSGSTRITERSHDLKNASSVSFSFFIKGAPFTPERLIHVYDIAGEVFTQNDENEVQKQYEYCQGIVFLLDPFSIPMVRNRYEDMLSAEDIAGIGTADISGIVDSFLNKLREVTGLSDSKMSKVPLAVVIGKTDSADLSAEIGDRAVKTAMIRKPNVFTDYYDTLDYLCRKFLRENGLESFVNSITLKFKDTRFFSCSAIGHTRDKGRYVPQGVMAPMQWLFGKADPKMAQVWNDITFSKRIPEFQEEK